MRDDSERQATGSIDDREVVLPVPRRQPDAAPAPSALSVRSSLDDLRVRIAALVEAVHNLPATGLELDEAQWRIDELAQEINRPYPSPPRVRSRWLRLAPLLTELDAALPVAATGRMIDDAF
ncbi:MULTISPECIES: hypothetical protein [unclassified Saccharopolyspora]|uniref:hypothetical protein n=1 Tax=unclassified Saccharopolyspora TaxID=2646250 RepID=UPI001CD1DC15|nr:MULTISPECIES: hypothetical protein [unclassified Saccharopolyspora]MCA1185454.1 hypothetical protein [Saccharopolyspora sp. 6T]MCA1225205.1 hypothetical protein [Saccharopolyspora sp. 6M]MCA1279556.1 hypothetical protein [Saccharopolyspora sp. 7B]